jgi:hypothetical protein
MMKVLPWSIESARILLKYEIPIPSGRVVRSNEAENLLGELPCCSTSSVWANVSELINKKKSKRNFFIRSYFLKKLLIDCYSLDCVFVIHEACGKHRLRKNRTASGVRGEIEIFSFVKKKF